VSTSASRDLPFAAAGPPLTPGESAQPRVPKRARLGRNLVAAIVVGLAMGGIILSSLLIQRHFFIAVLAVSAAIASWELAGALRRGAGIEVPLPVVLVGGQAMIWLAWPFGTGGLAASFGLTMVAALLWRMRGGASHFVRDVTATVFTAAYVPLCCGFAVLMTVAPDGLGRILTFMLPVIASDVGGYGAGVLFGRHPMAPTISPKKSWEGFAGSQVAGMATGAVCVVLFLGGPWWAGVLTGSLLVVSATLGDLVESMIKRDLGIKDMGNLLPGHGGMMDRLDSLLPTAVVAWLLLSLLVPA
jgi:phosphatidate cytidylyltransferase